MRLPGLLAISLALSGILSSSPARADPFAPGLNQAWIEGKYGHDLTDGFVEADWSRVISRTAASRVKLLRVWLFEGMAKEGIRWEGKKPAGLDPALIPNVRRVAALAAASGVRIYWTLGSANWGKGWPKAIDYERHWNLFQDRYGAGQLFRDKCLGPVLDALHERPGAVYGIDLLNESQGGVKSWAFTMGWNGARNYLKTTAAFVHRRAPGLKVSASSGHTQAVPDLLAGHFDGLGLDFLDVHVYTDQTAIPRGRELAAHARRQRVPIVIGEFGQKTEADDPALQARVTAGILADARRLGFAAAFAWRLDDGKGRFRFFDGDRPRPALGELTKAATAR